MGFLHSLSFLPVPHHWIDSPLTIMHTGNLVRTDRMLSPSLSLPCKHATVKAIMYPAAVHRGSAPEQESSTRSSNGLKRRFYAGGRMQGIEPKYHPNYSSDQLSACLAGWDTAPSSSPWGDANAVQVLHLLQEPWASFLAVQSQTRPASLLSPWGIFTYIFSSNLQRLAREWNAT